MENVQLIKFIESRLKHLSTRKDDRLRLEDCLETLNMGKQLDPTQNAFINLLQMEQKQRSVKYYKNAKTKTKV